MYIAITKSLLIIAIAVIFAVAFHDTYANNKKAPLSPEHRALLKSCSLDGENLYGDLKNPYRCA